MSQQEPNFSSPYAEVEQQDPSKQAMTHEEHSSENAHQMGSVIPFANVSALCTSCARGRVGQGNFLAAADHTHNFRAAAYWGTPSDEGFEDPQLGCFFVDILVNKLWVRTGNNVWKSVQLS